MKKKSIALAIALSALTAVTASAQEEATEENTAATIYSPITTGASFLSVAPDARGGGLGDVGAATSPDLDAQYWNPAKYAQMNGVGGASISYVPWLRKLVNDMDLISASGYYKIKNVQAVAMSFRFFSIGNVLMTKNADDAGMNFKPYDLSLDASYSRILSKHFSMGVALRFVYSDLTGGYSVDGQYVKPGWAISADIAGSYRHPFSMNGGTGYGAFGFNISNIGSKINYGDYNSSSFLPANLRLGGSVTMAADAYNHVSISLDINKLLVPGRPTKNTSIEDAEEQSKDLQNRLDEYHQMNSITGIFRSFADMPDGSAYDFKSQLQKMMFSIGFEYDYDNRFFGRVGYYNESKVQGNRKYFTFGVGFRLNVFALDVAYVLSVTKQNPLDQTLRFSLGFNMGGLKSLAGVKTEDELD
ncbi:MAG: type IX secretion system outer membrane channel protein PorV [Paludibacteraceae bacterium]|nr:type IX secretion system outer membrane channel protein PorV [Paludibacteraceae bacterium]